MHPTPSTRRILPATPPRRRPPRWRLAGLVAPLLLVTSGCGGKSDDALSVATSPKEAASQLESAFQSAPAAFKNAADAAADAMRRGEYVEAVDSLQVIKATQGVSVQQGLAVHGTLVQLEGQLAQAVAAGDPRAQAAYARLKALKAK